MGYLAALSCLYNAYSYYQIDRPFTRNSSRSDLDGALAGRGNSRRAGEGEVIDAAARAPEPSRHENV